VCDRGPDRGAFAAVREAEDEKVVSLRAAGEQLRRGVSRAVVGDDHLRVQVEGLDTVEQLVDRGRLVVDGDDERDARRQDALGLRIPPSPMGNIIAQFAVPPLLKPIRSAVG